MPTTVTIIRHGQTEWNKENRIQGHKDSPLSAQGVLEAQRTSQTIQAMQFDAIYSSDLGRAKQTTRLVLSPTQHKQAQFNVYLRERCLGIYDGTCRNRVEDNLQLSFRLFKDIDFIPKLGESIVQLRTRINLCIQHMYTHHKNQHILVITHGMFLKQLHHIITGVERSTSNTSITTLLFGEDHHCDIISWGNTDHL